MTGEDGMTRRHYLAATCAGAGALALGLGARGALAEQVISDIKLPDSQLARAATQFIRDTESDFLFQHSTRVYLWGALAGKRKGLTFDPELLYTAAMFHDVGLTSGFRESRLRYEVDGANAARDFLRSQGISESDTEKVWLAIAVHTTPGSPRTCLQWLPLLRRA